MDYNKFGDVLICDATYKTNRFKMPLFIFAGVNHHRSTVVFGCALINDERIETYKWVFRIFLHAMGMKKPQSILTDGDRAMKGAIKYVMPETRHRLCSWHLERNAKGICHQSGFIRQFNSCMLSSCIVDEFENKWAELVSKYNLNVDKKDWVKQMYGMKENWAEAFFRGTFFAGMTTTQRCEGYHSYIKRFVHVQQRLVDFVRHFGNSLRRARNNKDYDDFIASHSEAQLQTHMNSLEKEIEKIYTRTMYMEVHEI